MTGHFLDTDKGMTTAVIKQWPKILHRPLSAAISIKDPGSFLAVLEAAL
jgi:hypothetical protein